jgi:hypothetical protein
MQSMLTNPAPRETCNYIYQQLLNHIRQNNIFILLECLYEYHDINPDYLTQFQLLATADIEALAANYDDVSHPKLLFNLIVSLRKSNHLFLDENLLNAYQQYQHYAKAYYLTLANKIDDNNIAGLRDMLDLIYQQPEGDDILRAIQVRAIRLANITAKRRSLFGLFDPAETDLPIAVNNQIVQYLNERNAAQQLRLMT